MKTDDAELTLGLRLAYAGAVALPLVVGAFAAVRAPGSLDDRVEPSANIRDVDDDESPTRGERGEHHARTSASSEAPARPPIAPPLKVPSPASRAASDAFEHSLHMNDLKGALVQLEQLLEIDPGAPTDDTVRGDIVDLTMRIQLVAGPEPDKMFDLLVNHMGTTGIDILYQIVTTKGGSKAATLADKFLAAPEVRARGTDALRAAYDLRAAKTCEAKRAVFPAVADHGDGRSLGQLYLLNRRCGRRRRAETTCCLQGDADLAKTLDALEKRGVK